MKLITQISHILILFGGIILVAALRSIPLDIAGAFYIIVALNGLTASINISRFFPLPVKLKKWLLINISLKIELVIVKLFGIDSDTVMGYFIEMNNNFIKSPKGKILLLLPKCVQNSECPCNVLKNINNCKKCGKCQIPSLLDMENPTALEMYVVGGGRLAIKKVKEIRPDTIIAVACEQELIAGIKQALKIPVFALKNSRPNGPCVNTLIDVDELNRVIGKRKL